MASCALKSRCDFRDVRVISRFIFFCSIAALRVEGARLS
jgi:hypothetical protein